MPVNTLQGAPPGTSGTSPGVQAQLSRASPRRHLQHHRLPGLADANQLLAPARQMSGTGKLMRRSQIFWRLLEALDPTPMMNTDATVNPNWPTFFTA